MAYTESLPCGDMHSHVGETSTGPCLVVRIVGPGSLDVEWVNPSVIPVVGDDIWIPSGGSWRVRSRQFAEGEYIGDFGDGCKQHRPATIVTLEVDVA